MFNNHHPKRHALSFKYAYEGLDYVIKTQPNFRIHIVFALIVAVLAFMLNFRGSDWVLLILIVTFILVLEMINTIFEVLVDHLWQEEHPKAKIIKDVAAGVVLVGAIGATIAGSALFTPYLLPIVYACSSMLGWAI